ncbi:MAG: site-specific DNA-methyltransferase, partial [bacterium]|nr:site-specific DNA-methyltransferase [bacterium]
FAANYAQSKTHPQKIHESILVFGNKPKYYPQMTLRNKPIKKGKNCGAEMYGGVSGLGREDYKGKIYTHKYPESIIEFSSRAEKRGLHPTQKPLELMKYLIITYSNENDMVLDNTMGSGTTCIGAKQLNRKYIGIESDFDIFCNANNRVNNHDCKCDVCFQLKSIKEEEDNHFYCEECSGL